MARPSSRLSRNQMVHYLFHSHKFKVDQHAADRVVRFSVVIAGVNTVAQSGIGDNTVRG